MLLAPETRVRALITLMAVVAIVAPPGASRAEQVVVVREWRTSQNSAFGGVVRSVEYMDGPRMRQETTSRLAVEMRDDSSATDSARPPSKPDLRTAIWVPESRVWRTWEPGEKVFDEVSPADLAKSVQASGGAMDFLMGLFGGRRELVQDVDVQVDSTGEAATMAGLRARPYFLRATVRFYDLESNLGDSLQVVREIWMSSEIPGVSAALPSHRETPGRMQEKLLGSLAFMVLPMLGEAFDRTEDELATIGGYDLRDLVRIAPASAERAAAMRDSMAAHPEVSDLLASSEVIEIRREPSRPSLFRTPDGMRKREPPSKGEVKVTEEPKRSGGHR